MLGDKQYISNLFLLQLWALLHFIMPTLFDSHEEFNEWFSRDIESHAENKSAIDQGISQISADSVSCFRAYHLK